MADYDVLLIRIKHNGGHKISPQEIYEIIMGLPVLEAIFNLLSQKTWIFTVKFSIFKSSRHFLLPTYTKTRTIKFRPLQIDILRQIFLSTVKHQHILYYYIHTGI